MGSIVVGVDGSEGSKLALRWAADEARLRACSLDVVYVYEHTPSWQLYAYGEGPLGGIGEPPLAGATDDDEAAEERARELLDAVIRDIAPGVDLDLRPVTIEDRRPARVLVERSKDADMLVIGSRGRGGFAGLLLGSVSQQCTQHATCPVVVINTPDADEQ
jgi:nucleotide-binding universal stress UspA family protein